MLPKPNRLPKEEFKKLFTHGKRIHIPEFQIIVSPSHATISRFAVIVGKNISKRAVERNRIKRLIRESIQHLLPQIVQSIDCVIIVKKNFSSTNQTEIELTIKKIFVNNNLLLKK